MNTLPNPLHGDWVDSIAEWSVTHQKISEAELDRFIAERHTLPIPLLTEEPQQPVPAECCTELGAEPANLSGLPLEPYLNRHKWLGPLMVALIGFVWLCIDGYLENLPQ